MVLCQPLAEDRSLTPHTHTQTHTQMVVRIIQDSHIELPTDPSGTNTTKMERFLSVLQHTYNIS